MDTSLIRLSLVLLVRDLRLLGRFPLFERHLRLVLLRAEVGLLQDSRATGLRPFELLQTRQLLALEKVRAVIRELLNPARHEENVVESLLEEIGRNRDARPLVLVVDDDFLARGVFLGLKVGGVRI